MQQCKCSHERMQHVFTYGHCMVCGPKGCPRYDPDMLPNNPEPEPEVAPEKGQFESEEYYGLF
jgi:hypothetical protein